MSRGCVMALALCGLATVCSLPGADAQALSSPYESLAAATESRFGWNALDRLYALLAHHGALDGHELARKSGHSLSRRLRFGRRSDPDMPPQTPTRLTVATDSRNLIICSHIVLDVVLTYRNIRGARFSPDVRELKADEMEELLSLRDVRTPVRLRFGRRSDEHAVPHVFPQELNEVDMSPRDLRTPLRLRFGRRSDDTQKTDEADEIMSLRDIRTPLRLRFGRRSDDTAAPHSQKIDESDEVMSLRDVRTPLRLRFGRRSEERAVPHTFPQEEQERAGLAPTMRLRFGRGSDNTFSLPYETAQPKEVKADGSVEDDRQQE